jgi:hypothetical protein
VAAQSAALLVEKLPLPQKRMGPGRVNFIVNETYEYASCKLFWLLARVADI